MKLEDVTPGMRVRLTISRARWADKPSDYSYLNRTEGPNHQVHTVVDIIDTPVRGKVVRLEDYAGRLGYVAIPEEIEPAPLEVV